MKEKVRNPAIPADVLDHFRDRGWSRIYCAYYSCKYDGVLQKVVAAAIQYTLHPDSVFRKIEYTEVGLALNPEIQQHFVDKEFCYRTALINRPVVGHYLMLATPIVIEDQGDAGSVSGNVETCAAMVSLMHGEFVATERHFSCEVDLEDGQKDIFAPWIYVRQTLDGENLNQGIASILDQEADVQFQRNPTGISLIRRSHHERDPTLKFLFMWLAVECIIGDGKDRRNFAIQEMKSEILNQVMVNLREKRSSLLHDGLMIELTHKDYLRIKCIVFMALTSNIRLRAGLLKYLEENLSLD